MVYDSNSPFGRSGRGYGPGNAYGPDFGDDREDSYTSAREYEAAGEYGGDTRRGYGTRDHGHQRHDQRDRMGQRSAPNRGQGGGYGGDRGYYGDRGYGGSETYRGAYGSDGRPFEDYGRERWRSDDRYNDPDRPRGGDRDTGSDRSRGYGRQPQGYSYEDRGFLARAGDEVRSWFGDDEAERRRDQDARLDERHATDRDRDYHSWRRGQIDALDRDYHEYRQENRSRFENEFSTWRTARQGQRDALSSVKERMDVVGSDGTHVGTVDKVRGDRILLTKNDADAGGRHHSIPSRWIDRVGDTVTLSKTAAEAKQAWQDEENRQAMSGWGDRTDDRADRERGGREGGGTNLDRSFSGTY